MKFRITASFIGEKKNFIFCFFFCMILYFLSRNTHVEIKPRERPWFFSKNGTARAKQAKFSPELGRRDANLLPNEDLDDRFENQLMFIPPNYDEKNAKIKTIYFYNLGPPWWGVDGNWNTWFSQKPCPVNRCRLTTNHNESSTADMILFWPVSEKINITKSPHQVYAFYRLESPMHYVAQFEKSLIYNWTITYRHDSTLPIPYYKWLYYDERIKQMKQTVNYAQNKTKKAAILVSNCKAHNDRQIYVSKLAKYIEVDVYGKCGTKNCSNDMNQCLDMVTKDYKFYLSFENSHCVDYITEKVYRNALERSVLPVVLGARKEDYERFLPLNSFIYVEDFATPKDLADYLHKVDKDDNLYNSYFQWRGTGELRDKFEYLWCRVCALLHDEYTMNTPHWYDDINKWWNDPETVRRGFWRNTQG